MRESDQEMLRGNSGWTTSGNRMGEPTRSARSWPREGTNEDQRLESGLCLSRNLDKRSYLKEDSDSYRYISLTGVHDYIE